MSTISSRFRNLSLKRRFRRDFLKFKGLSESIERGFDLRWENRLPFLHDWSDSMEFDRQYLFHTAWASRVLARTRPDLHVDVSSYVFFASIVSAFIPVRYLEFRSFDLGLSNLESDQANLLSLPLEDNSVGSMSCMHVLEHIGLGRYGDPIDPEGDLKAIAEIKRVMKPGGDLLVVVPVGHQEIRFNAHRIYNSGQFSSYFNGYETLEFALIPDNPAEGNIVVMPSDELLNAQVYGCGCFWFRKVKD